MVNGVVVAADVLAAVRAIPDPEIPVITIEGLGILRGLTLDDAAGEVHVVITPTYSGCPAMHTIEEEIRTRLRRDGIEVLNFETIHSPPWTTDWMTPTAKRKLQAYGIAPPMRTEAEGLIPMPCSRRPVLCPFCGSAQTELKSEFGSTACKSLMFCDGCKQPFEYFKSF